MAKGKNIAIWIIVVIVLAAAAGVITIVVQNAKREDQLNTIQSSASLYATNNPAKAVATTASVRARPPMRMNTQQRQQQQQHLQQKQQQQQHLQQQVQQHQHEYQQKLQQQQKQQHQPARYMKQRYNIGSMEAEAHMANMLPPGHVNSNYNSGVGMTVFSNPPPPSHLMSTSPMPSSGSGALFIPSKSPQAQMPAQQLFASHNFPSTVENQLQSLSVSPSNTDSAVNISTNSFTGSSYFQDPAQMTPNTYADGLGLDAYMPNVSNATPNGLDPQTGLPVFSTASLKRSNELSSRGLQGFLRPTMDDSQGYKSTIGKRSCYCRYSDEMLQQRRNQFNAARVDGADEPVLWNMTDFMYFP